MADQRRPSSENRYSVEIDGIPAFKATKITGGDEKHEPVKVTVGNDPYAKLGRGNVAPEEVQITIPSGLYDGAIKALAAWLVRYNDGQDTTPKSGRYMTYDDRGKTPIETWELRDCVPIALKPDDKNGDGTNAATVTLTILPEKVRSL
jgi:hypothetical protein